MCYFVCEIMHIKEPLLLIGKMCMQFCVFYIYEKYNVQLFEILNFDTAPSRQGAGRSSEVERSLMVL